jgi:hypothetical protein
MTYLILGVVGIIASGWLSRYIFTAKTGRSQPLYPPFEGMVPAWVSAVNLASWGCAVVGVAKLILPA